MTRFADSHNNEPKLTFVTFVMMVFYSLFTTRALKSVGRGKLTYFNCIANSMASLPFCYIVFAITSLGLFVFIACSMLSVGQLATFALKIVFTAILTMWFTAIFCSGIPEKFSNRFGLFALSASFCYDWIRHGFFLLKKSCLKPLQTQYLCGLFLSYQITNKRQLNKEILCQWNFCKKGC